MYIIKQLLSLSDVPKLQTKNIILHIIRNLCKALPDTMQKV